MDPYNYVYKCVVILWGILLSRVNAVTFFFLNKFKIPVADEPCNTHTICKLLTAYFINNTNFMETATMRLIFFSSRTFNTCNIVKWKFIKHKNIIMVLCEKSHIRGFFVVILKRYNYKWTESMRYDPCVLFFLCFFFVLLLLCKVFFPHIWYEVCIFHLRR